MVIAIIGTLVGLLLPAVQTARESARRSDCGSKLKQVALAAINFQSARGAFPANNSGTVGVAGSGVLAIGEGTTNVAGSTNKSYGTHVFLLPFMEEQNVYNAINFSSSAVNAVNSGLRNTTIAGFACPSDPNAVFLNAFNRTGNAAPDNFKGNQIGGVCGETAGTSDSGLTNWSSSAQFLGQFCSYPGSCGDADTMANHSGFCGATGYATYGCGAAADGPAPGAGSYAAVGSAAGAGAKYRGIFANRFANNAGYIGSDGSPRLPRQTPALVTDGLSKTILFGHTTTNSTSQNGAAFYAPSNVKATSTPLYMGNQCAKESASWYTVASSKCYNYSGGELWGFSSHHGVNVPVAMADGGVRWLTETIDQKVYNALGSKNGENPIGFTNEASTGSFE